MPFELWRWLPIFLAAPAQIAFIVIWSSTKFGAGQWWKTKIGRTLFIKSLGLTILLVNIALTVMIRLATGDYSHAAYDLERYTSNFEFLIVAGYWIVMISVYYQLGSLIKERFLQKDPLIR